MKNCLVVLIIIAAFWVGRLTTPEKIRAEEHLSWQSGYKAGYAAGYDNKDEQ